MTPLQRQIILIGLLLMGILFYERMRPVPQPPGILAPDPPRVSAIGEKEQNLVRNDYVFTALAKLDAKARVLSIERYGYDRESQAALLDVVLGWGRMSDSTTLKQVDVAQTQRRAVWKSYDPAFSDADVEASIVNLHLVTADAAVEKTLRELRVGNLVRLEGFLVEAAGGDGWRWKGQPKGDLPATLLWVERAEIVQPG